MLGLRSRVVVSFAALALLVALAVSLTAYGFARSYLLSQRQTTAVTTALLNARAVSAAVAAGTAPGDALSAVPAVGQSQALARVDGTWYTRGVTVSPSDLPHSLLEAGVRLGAAQQLFAVDGRPTFGVVVNDGTELYLELFPVDDLDSALRAAGWLMTALVVLSTLIGALIGWSTGGRLMRPLRSLGDGATRIAEGDLSVRLHATGDPDLDPISSAFNGMADAVEQRISRERRFAANVGHELRSPVTTVLGTAEILEAHQGQMAQRDANLVASLVGQARRLSQTLIDLLDLGSTGPRTPVQVEAVDVAAVAASLLAARDLPEGLLRADRALVRTDARRVERVVANFLDNAARHGGGVTAVVVERAPDAVLVHVDDAGPGLGDASTERIFEPFVRGGSPQSHEPRDGAGLGLAIAKEQATAIRARIVVGTSPDGGARFTLALPTGGV